MFPYIVTAAIVVAAVAILARLFRKALAGGGCFGCPVAGRCAKDSCTKVGRLDRASKPSPE